MISSPQLAPGAVAWDIDGTLVDSEPVHQRALERVCAAHRVSLDGVRPDSLVGVHARDVWQCLRARLPESLDLAQWLHEIDREYLAEAHRLRTMPCAVRTVMTLASRGIPQVAVSNSGRRIVDRNLAVGELSSHMVFSISLDDVDAGKPDPAPYLQAARRLNLPPHRVLAIEDSLTGVRSARAAGCQVWLYGSSGVAADVQRSISSLDEVFGLLEDRALLA